MIRILIAEDEQRIASFIDKGLSAAGFTTTVVADGASAYDYARGSTKLPHSVGELKASTPTNGSP